MRRLDLGPEVNDAAMNEFAIGVGLHGLVRGLKRRNNSYDEVDRAVLNGIADRSYSVVEGLREAGHYLDPRSIYSGSAPTWALDK